MYKGRSKLLRILRKQWLLIILSIVVVIIYIVTHFKCRHIRKLKSMDKQKYVFQGAKSNLKSAQMNEVASPAQVNIAVSSAQKVANLSTQDRTESSHQKFKLTAEDEVEQQGNKLSPSMDTSESLIQMDKATSSNSIRLRILLPNQYATTISLDGYYVGRNITKHRGSNVSTSFLFTWSPDVENMAAKHFVDPLKENIYHAVSPSIAWVGRELLFICRIWLGEEKYRSKKINHYIDNNLYIQRFNVSMAPINRSSFIAINTPIQFHFGQGPRGLRLFTVKGRPFIIFGTPVLVGKLSGFDSMYFWDVDEERVIIPEIEGGAPMAKQLSKSKYIIEYYDKNWMPFDLDNKLHVVYTLDPLMTLKCEFTGSCRVVYQSVNQTNFGFFAQGGNLRGGTPFILYSYPYYISFAHSTLHSYHPLHDGTYYNVHLVVLRVEPFALVYISQRLRFNPAVFEDQPRQRTYIKADFVFPHGLVIEDQDSVLLTGHVNDHSSAMFRIQGIKAIM